MLPQRQNPNRQKVSKGITLPAPTSGWFIGNNLAETPPLTAYQLDNFFPVQDHVRVRRGTSTIYTWDGVALKTLFAYQVYPTGRLFAASATDIYENGTASPVVTGMTNADWSVVQMTTSGGTFLRLVNGADTPQLFDGTSWTTTPAITGTGLTPENLSFVWTFKNRLYFIEKHTTKVWYLSVDSIGGSATALPLGGVFAQGGYLVAGATWSISSNSGLYETFVVITSEGEVAMYDGSYPGDTAWTLKGLYKIGKPLGRNPFFKAGGDLLVLTEDGMVPMSKVMTLDRIALSNEAITAPIAPYWRDRVLLADTDDTPFSLTVWPRENMAIITVPIGTSEGISVFSTAEPQQLVVNARTGAWARYTGWPAKAFCVVNDSLYYCTDDGKIVQAEVGGEDNGASYSAKLIMSWNDFRMGAARKQVKAMRAVYRATTDAAPKLEVVVDYDGETSAAPAAPLLPANVARWDSAHWDVDVWPGSLVPRASWKTVSGFGTMIAPVLQMTIASSDQPDFRFQQFDVLFEGGSIIG